MALMEEFIPGRTENLHDYLIPSIGDMPNIETIFIEKPDPAGPCSPVSGLQCWLPCRPWPEKIDDDNNREKIENEKIIDV